MKRSLRDDIEIPRFFVSMFVQQMLINPLLLIYIWGVLSYTAVDVNIHCAPCGGMHRVGFDIMQSGKFSSAHPFFVSPLILDLAIFSLVSPLSLASLSLSAKLSFFA